VRNPPNPQSLAAWRWGLPALLVLGPLLAWPLGVLVGRAISSGGLFTFATLIEVTGDPVTWQRLAFTLAQALISAGLALLIGLPTAYVLSRVPFPGRGFVHALATLPLVLPTVVVALGIDQTLGATGWVNLALERAGRLPLTVTGTLWGILIAHTVFGLAIVVWVVGATWGRLAPGPDEAARVLGATPRQAFRHVTLPQLMPAITSAALLVFTFAFTSFGVVLLLGGPESETLSVTIYRLGSGPAGLAQAAALSLLQLLVTLAALARTAGLQRAPRIAAAPAPAGSPRRLSVARAALAVLVVTLVLVIVELPLASLVLGAVTRDGTLTSVHFASALADLPSRNAIASSLGFAAVAMIIAVLVGGTAAVAVARTGGRTAALADAALMLPLALPVVVGVAYLAAAGTLAVDLRRSPVLILAAHAVIAVPLVLRAVLPAARALPPRLPEAAAVLGASPARGWRAVQLPLLAPALVIGAAFAFAISLGDVGATLLLAGEFTTIPVAIVEALARGGAGDAGRALALGTLLLGACVVAFVIIERARRDRMDR
jgi:thiamine transport system permease protein